MQEQPHLDEEASVFQLGDVMLVIAKKERNDDEDNPVKYLATNKIDAPTAHIIRSYAIR